MVTWSELEKQLFATISEIPFEIIMGKDLFLKPCSNPYYRCEHTSHKGHIRTGNEDRIAVREFSAANPNETPVLLAVLADGVGGHRAGEIAAQIGVNTIIDTFSACRNLLQPERLLEKAIQKANQQVLAHTTVHPETKGMGATCICVLLISNQLYLANLGDSRAYILRGGDFKQASFDHTWFADASDLIAPEMKEKIGRNHPMSHILTRYLGSAHPVNVDLRIRLGTHESDLDLRKNQGKYMKSGDCVLLCSDGLTDMLDDSTIEKLVVKKSLKNAAQTLLQAALDAGGFDNISLILIQFP